MESFKKWLETTDQARRLDTVKSVVEKPNWSPGELSRYSQKKQKKS